MTFLLPPVPLLPRPLRSLCRPYVQCIVIVNDRIINIKQSYSWGVSSSCALFPPSPTLFPPPGAFFLTQVAAFSPSPNFHEPAAPPPEVPSVSLYFGASLRDRCRFVSSFLHLQEFITWIMQSCRQHTFMSLFASYTTVPQAATDYQLTTN